MLPDRVSNPEPLTYEPGALYKHELLRINLKTYIFYFDFQLQILFFVLVLSTK